MPGGVAGCEIMIMNAGRLAVDEQVTYLRAALTRNQSLISVLERAARWDLRGWYLVAGCLYQTVWNVVTGQPPQAGILDYDLIYFDGSDLSWDAEDALIRESGTIFADIPVRVQIRNQARVHLWYQDKFGVPCRPHQSSEAATFSTSSPGPTPCSHHGTFTRPRSGDGNSNGHP
jgi:uncharacterized protein